MDGWMDVSEVEDQSKIESTRSSLPLFMSYELPLPEANVVVRRGLKATAAISAALTPN